ncbi:MAG: hypothetical protein JWO07_422 [Candidatus Saccharibacteria bacterium]|nr:hypothetical protein [Candidatus Saccharibacteria bacterium]
MDRKRLIIIGAIGIAILVAIIGYFLLQKTAGQKFDTPTKSVVKQGETVVPNSSAGAQSTTNSGANSSQATVAQAPPTTQDYYNAILQTNGVAADADGQVRFGITDIKEPLPGWFVVTVTKTGTEPNKVIFQQTGNANSPLTVVAGPGTDFPPQYISLPDAVRKAL